jgi:cytochrome c553
MRLISSSLLILSALSAFSAQAIETSAELVTEADALSPDSARGRQLYEQNCVRCHRVQGSSTGAREYPQLGGQREEYLLEQLANFISLGRLSPKMHQVLLQASLTAPQSLRDISFYLANQPHDAHGEHGDGHNLGRGRRLYTKLCSKCHGELGQGNSQGPIPAVGGQNYTYLHEQVSAFVGGHRSIVEPALMDTMRGLSDADARAVADYMSQMPASVDVHYGVIGEVSTPPGPSAGSLQLQDGPRR